MRMDRWPNRHNFVVAEPCIRGKYAEKERRLIKSQRADQKKKGKFGNYCAVLIVCTAVTKGSLVKYIISV